jgi:UDP-N-acetylmuramoylalanine--D-glutamate ligase
LKDKKVLVMGLGLSGQAACGLLKRHGSQVTGWDDASSEALRLETKPLADRGILLRFGGGVAPAETFDLVVVSPGVSTDHPVVKALVERDIPVLGELELGYQHSYCLNVSVTGTNGKTTTTGLIERTLRENQMKVLTAGNQGVPLSAVAERSKELDFLILEVNSFQLETIKYFRPAVAVMLNIKPDHQDRYGGMADYVRAKARLLSNQQAFDWAIIQSEVLAQLQIMQVPIRSKVITFSAYNRRADIYLERGLIISRMAGWTGPLLNMDTCRTGGPHHAENIMAALAVGRVLRVPLDGMLEPVRSFIPPPHRCELVTEIHGVKYVNDAKSTNVDSLHRALLSQASGGMGGDPNVWLIAGGRDKGSEFHDIGPLLSQRVKGVFLLGEARDKLRAAWSLFTPCTLVDSLLEAVQEAARNARAGDIVLLSPACSSLDQFESYQHRGDLFRQAVKELARMASDQPSSEPSG